MKKNNFSNFTNLYELSKTLIFELKPVGETTKLLEKNKVFKKDETVNQAYHKIKPYLDQLHIEFIEESLQNSTKLDLSQAYQKFLEIEKQTDKKLKNKLKDELFWKNKKWWIFWTLRKDITNAFTITWKNWKQHIENKSYKDEKWKEKNYQLKWEGYKILMSDTNLDILFQKFPEETHGSEVTIKKYIKNPDYNNSENQEAYLQEEQNLFKSFKWFTTYFTNFNHSRENFYKDDGKAGRIATRIINENLIFFLKNKKNFDEKYAQNPEIKEKLQKVLDDYWETLKDFFSLENYNNCLTWKQIQYHNQIIWLLNIEINQEKLESYSKHKSEKKRGKEDSTFNKNNYPIFKELHKQILSKESWEKPYIEIENFDHIKTHLQELIEKNNNYNKIAQQLIHSLVEDLENNEEEKKYNFSKIYLSKASINTISAKFFGFSKWELIINHLLQKIGKKNKNGRQELPDFISLENIKTALEIAKKEAEKDNTIKSKPQWEEKKEDIFKAEFHYIPEENIFFKFIKVLEIQLLQLFQGKQNLDGTPNIIWYNTSQEKIENEIFVLQDFSDNKKEKENQYEIIKNYLDTSLNIFRMMKYFSLEKWKESVETDYEIDDTFYNKFKKYYIDDNQIIDYYNSFRNYLTKKPYSTDKIKLNFENATLIDGWDKNKEPDNFWTLLRKDGKYYLALQVYGKKNIFYKKKGSQVESIKEAFEIRPWEETYQKLDYKFLPDPKKMLPKVCFAKGNLELFTPSDEILKIKQEETFKIWDNFIRPDFEKIVNYYKNCLKKYPDWQVFNFNFSDTSNYQNLSDFYKEVEIWSYNISFRNVWENYIHSQIQVWNIYLFEIWNKDLKKHTNKDTKKTGKQNLHTLYFTWLFEENNLKNTILKLNGQAEIFLREASIKQKIDKNRKTKINIIEKKRYTEKKLFFHCPIKLNFAKHDTSINNKILKYISHNKEINIIWVDRGEKHLAYFSVINRKWEVLKDNNGKLIKWSLNEIEKFDKNGNKLSPKNYHDLLSEREQERKEARWSWKTIWNIKDLKQGYISQIVHKLACLIIEHNAILVFEDLNIGFKRGRQKIEKQIYQKLEKALIEKLNYLTFKDRNFWENGHYLRAYQLTEAFESFEKMGKQTGLIFYTDPSYTSATCPKCGFRKDLYIKYSNLENARKDIQKIDSITFDGKKFIFEYNNKKVFSDRDRKINKRNSELNHNFETHNYFVNDKLINLFDTFSINYKTWENIIPQIIEKNEKTLFSDTFYNFNMILSLRNSIIWDNSKNGDFICCPCCNFDSRVENEIGIECWDDNGAYNIARKGLIILDKIDETVDKKWDVSKIQWGDMVVSREDWDSFVNIDETYSHNKI